MRYRPYLKNPYDPYLPVRTRDGKRVRIHTTEGNDPDYPIIGEVETTQGTWNIKKWDRDGYYIGPHTPRDLDLTNYPFKKLMFYSRLKQMWKQTSFSHTLLEAIEREKKQTNPEGELAGEIPEGAQYFRYYDIGDGKIEFYKVEDNED